MSEYGSLQPQPNAPLYEAAQKVLGLDELHMYDIYVPLVDVEWQIPYPEAVEMLKKGVAVLGESYGRY